MTYCPCCFFHKLHELSCNLTLDWLNIPNDVVPSTSEHFWGRHTKSKACPVWHGCRWKVQGWIIFHSNWGCGKHGEKKMWGGPRKKKSLNSKDISVAHEMGSMWCLVGFRDVLLSHVFQPMWFGLHLGSSSKVGWLPLFLEFSGVWQGCRMFCHKVSGCRK